MTRIYAVAGLAAICAAMLGVALALAWRDGAREAGLLREEIETNRRMDDEDLDRSDPSAVRERLCLLAGRTDCDLRGLAD